MALHWLSFLCGLCTFNCFDQSFFIAGFILVWFILFWLCFSQCLFGLGLCLGEISRLWFCFASDHPICFATQTLPVCTTAGFQHCLTESRVGPEGPQCFLSSSPDNRLSPRGSPGRTNVSNGPLSKVALV